MYEGVQMVEFTGKEDELAGNDNEEEEEEEEEE